MRVVESYMKARIPLETFVTDSQYMDKDQDFTFSADYAVDDFQVYPSFLHCLHLKLQQASCNAVPDQVVSKNKFPARLYLSRISKLGSVTGMPPFYLTLWHRGLVAYMRPMQCSTQLTNYES